MTEQNNENQMQQPPANENQMQQPPAPPVQPEQPLTSFNTTAPEQVPAYQSIIEQQNAQIEALMAQNAALSGQITQMVQNGAQFTQQQQQQQQPAYQHQEPVTQQGQYSNFYEGNNPLQHFAPPSLSDNSDWSLEGLAGQIGKDK